MAIVRPTANLNVTTHLPGELIDTIIGHLPDHASIKVSSLLSRAWVPWTRVRLFSQVRLVMSNLLPFILLLQSPYCTFPCYVPRIYIEAFLSAIPNSYHKRLLAVLNGPHPWLDAVDATSWSFVSKIKTSMGNAIDRSEPSHVMNLFCLFPAIQHLHLHMWNFRYSIGGCSGLPPMSHTLKSLTLTHGIYPSSEGVRLLHWKNFLKWAVRYKVCNISRLYLDVMAPWNSEGVEAFLKIQGNSLKHLHVGVVRPGMLPLHFKHSEIETDVS
jgi:hypothetical protein